MKARKTPALLLHFGRESTQTLYGYLAIDTIENLFLYILFAGALLWFVYTVLLNVWWGVDDSPYTAISLMVYQTVRLIFVTLLLVKLHMIHDNHNTVQKLLPTVVTNLSDGLMVPFTTTRR